MSIYRSDEYIFKMSIFLKRNLKISILPILGITISVASLLIAIGVVNGLSENTLSSLLSVLPHIKSESRFGIIKNYDSEVDKIGKIVGVKKAFPKLVGKGILRFFSPIGEAIEGVLIDGIRESDLELNIVSGELSLERDEILIGEELYNLLQADVGDKIELLSHENRKRSFTISGVFHSGFYHYDSNVTIISLESAQELLDIDGVTEIDIKLKDIYAAEKLIPVVEKSTLLISSSWMKMNQQLLKGILLERRVVIILFSLLLIISGFILSILMGNTIQSNIKEIGILRAIGFSKRYIALSFINISQIFSTVGILLGLLLTFIFKLIVENNMFISLKDVYYISNSVPFKLTLWEIFLVILATKIVVLIAIALPIINAANIDPIKALKHE